MDKGITERSLLDIITIQPSPSIIDPSLNQNSQLIYSDQHSFLIKIQQKPDTTQTLKQPQRLRVKLMAEYDHNSPKTLKIQLTSDTQIYFNFIFECNDWQFKRIKANQNFFIEFREYPDFIIKNFQRLRTTDKYIGSFTIFSENQGKLDIIRHSEFKDDVIMEFDFVKASQEQVKKSIQYRYNLMRYQYQQYKNKYDNVCDTIKQKNPSLAIQIQKIHKK